MLRSIVLAGLRAVMGQKQLSEFSKADTQFQIRKEERAEAPPAPMKWKQEKTRRHVFPPVAPDDLSCSYLVSAGYDGQRAKALIKLYEPVSGQIYFWYDNTGHMPYCLTNLSRLELEKIPRLMQHPGLDHFETVEKYDPLQFRKVQVTKIVARDPLAIGG